MFWLAVLFLHAAVAAAQVGASGAAEFTGPAQAKRGHALFFEGVKGEGEAVKAVACATCHAIGGKGTPAGPDLTKIARLSPRAFVVAILATRTQYVQAVKPKAGDTFPAMKVREDEKGVHFYDLSKSPPEARTLAKEEIASTSDNQTWKHPPESAGYSNEQLADVIAYIKYASYKDTAGVKAEDLE